MKTIFIIIILLLISTYVSYNSYRLAYINYENGDLYVSDEIYYVDTARRYLQFIFHVNVNESMYSNKTNPDYFNLEHPPLAKYLIALSMKLYGDNPIGWRLPGIIEAGLIPFTLGLAFWLRSKRTVASAVIAIAAASAAAADPILIYSGSVAMLDIHLAFFLTLSLAFMLLGRRRTALVMSGLATAAKMSGLAAVLAIMLYDLIDGDFRSKVKRLAEDILMPFIVFVVVMVPLIIYFGPVDIVRETLSALRWHTTSRPPGPPTSTPIGWILNSNPFYYSFSPVVEPAILNTALHLFAVINIVPLTFLGSVKEKYRDAVIAPLFYVGTLALYTIIWLLGNRTFYSFYAVELTPAMAGIIGSLLLVAERMRSDE